MSSEVEELLAERAIRRVLYRYCRGIDRRDADLIRSCYWPDAVDDHGTYVGAVEGFIEHALGELQRYERTMHMIGNVLIDHGSTEATCESYVLSYHRLPARKVPYERDFLVALRYLDRFRLRDGEWKIQQRTCVYEWTRLDAVEDSFKFPGAYGSPSTDDPVYGLVR